MNKKYKSLGPRRFESEADWRYAQMRRVQEREKELRQKKRQALIDIIKPLEDEREKWTKERDSWVAKETKELAQKINDDLLQIEKLRLAVKLQRGALKNFEKEGRGMYEDKHPFPKEKELKAARQKLYKL